MPSTKIKNRIKEYFTKPYFPRSAFYLSSRYLSGIHVSPKERKVKYHFITPIESGVIKPSFTKKNIEKAVLLEKKIKEGLEKLHLADQKIACLIPELSLQAFVLSFDSLPPSFQEREQVIRFRIKKQMALLPEDVRLSFKVIKSDHSEKVIVSLARASTIQDYEDFLRKLGLKVRGVSSPVLSLYNVMSREGDGEFLLINIEEESLSLVAVINSEIVLYRQKPFGLESQEVISSSQIIESIVKEVENTANFVEDRDKKKIVSLWIRLGVLGPEEEIFAKLKKKLSFPLKRIDVPLVSNLAMKERQFLSPLIGQIL